MLEADANVKIVAEILLPLMKGFCVFHTSHRKALEKKQPDNKGMLLPPSLNWKGLALGNPRLWYGELDMLLCPNLNFSVSQSGHFLVAVVQKDKDFVPELSCCCRGLVFTWWHDRIFSGLCNSYCFFFLVSL